MKNLDEIIKRFNLFFTNTVDRNNCDLNCVDDLEVNYDNCISLYDLIKRINEMHISFTKEYNELEKLDLGEDIEIVDYYAYPDLSYRELLLFIYNSKISDSYDDFLHIIDDNGNVSSYISTGLNLFDKKEYVKTNLDNEKLKKYIDLIEKYNLLFYLYYRFRNDLVFGDGTHIMHSEIKSVNDNILDGLDKLIIKLGFDYQSLGTNIDLVINLGNEFSINNNECKIDLYGTSIDLDNDCFTDLLKKIYINEKYLNGYYDRVKKIEKVNIKKLNKSL